MRRYYDCRNGEWQETKNVGKCKDKRANANPHSYAQENSHPPSEDDGEQPRIIPTYTSETHYSHMPLCTPDFLMTPPHKPQSVKQLLSPLHDNLTNKS